MTVGDLQLASLRARIVSELEREGRVDLIAVLDELTGEVRHGAIRVVVVGETKRGKSTLVNTLVGRPLLSPVGVDVTTACWLELRHGEQDEAVVVLADPDSPGAPRRVPIEVREVERYVALTEVADPVLGVEVRLRAPMLRDLVLIDTPGVGGLRAGHSRTTLAALKQADALLFVCDASQPILLPEVEFLAEAAGRVPAVVVAATKCDANPSFEVVVAETRSRLGRHPLLRDVPVFAVAATLADRAAEMEDGDIAAVLTELSGMAQLVGSLRRQARAGDALRAANTAQVLGNAAKTLAAQASASATAVELSGNGDANSELTLQSTIDNLVALREDRVRLSILARQHLARLRVEPLDSFDLAASALRRCYLTEAERGPAAQLHTLAPRMLADLTASGIATLEAAAEQTTTLMRRLLDTLGVTELANTVPARSPSTLDLKVTAPTLAGTDRLDASLTRAAAVFGTLTKLVAGAATVVSVLSGPGVIASCLALAAGAGWWRVRGDGERQRRAQLGAWVDIAVREAKSGFDREMRRRVQDVEEYVEGVLPELLTGQQQQLSQLRSELAELRRAGQQAHAAAIAARREQVARLDRLVSESELLATTLLNGK